MANINVVVDRTIADGYKLKFRTPCDSTTIEGLEVKYPAKNGVGTLIKKFVFKDAHGTELSGVGNLFVSGVMIEVLLDVTHSVAYIQNADTNSYVESVKGEVQRLEESQKQFLSVAGKIVEECEHATKEMGLAYDDIVSGGHIENLKEFNSGDKFSVWVGDLEQYNELTEKVSNRLYVITHDILGEDYDNALDANTAAIEENKESINVNTTKIAENSTKIAEHTAEIAVVRTLANNVLNIANTNTNSITTLESRTNELESVVETATEHANRVGDMVDWVIECGSDSDGWNWCKWYSGRVELWRNKTVEAYIEAGGYKMVGFMFPFEFNSIPNITVTAHEGAGGSILANVSGEITPNVGFNVKVYNFGMSNVSNPALYVHIVGNMGD